MLAQIAAFFLVFAVFLATVAVALMAGQQRNRKAMGKIEQQISRLLDANMSDEEREERQRIAREIEEKNNKAREEFEYGGC